AGPRGECAGRGEAAMRRTWILGLALAPASAVVVACTGDDEIYAPEKDAGAVEAAAPDGSGTSPPADAGASPRACGDAGGAPPRLLVTIGASTAGELAAVNLQSNAVDGRLAIP